MHYYVKDHTPVVKGDFDRLSTGINGGRGQVRSVINHEVGKGFRNDEPLQFMDGNASALLHQSQQEHPRASEIK